MWASMNPVECFLLTIYENIYIIETCPALSEPANGKLKYLRPPRYTPATIVSVTCDYWYAKYYPPGSSKYIHTFCQTSGTWNQENPTCVQGNEATCHFLINSFQALWQILSQNNLKCLIDSLLELFFLVFTI